MRLVLRRQASTFIPPWDRDKFWSVLCDGVPVGVILAGRGRSDEPPHWAWAIHLHAGRHGNGLRHACAMSGTTEGRDGAMAAFLRSFDICLAVIGEEGWRHHVEHIALLDAQAAR